VRIGPMRHDMRLTAELVCWNQVSISGATGWPFLGPSLYLTIGPGRGRHDRAAHSWTPRGWTAPTRMHRTMQPTGGLEVLILGEGLSDQD
jgi:hypothetical protein